MFSLVHVILFTRGRGLYPRIHWDWSGRRFHREGPLGRKDSPSYGWGGDPRLSLGRGTPPPPTMDRINRDRGQWSGSLGILKGGCLVFLDICDI